MNRTLKIGTRASPLALQQAEQVASAIRGVSLGASSGVDLGFDPEVVKIVSTGDKILDRSLSAIGGKGLFAKELESALLDGRIDIAVHSMKDLETNLPDGLMLAATVAREDARDVLITDKATNVETLPLGAKVGSASSRRKAQLLAQRPDLKVDLIRGNVARRMSRIESGEFDATILAAAGLDRLGMLDTLISKGIAHPLEIDGWLPAVCQGIVGIEIAEAASGDTELMALMNHLTNENSWFCASMEREVLRKLDGSCKSAISVHCIATGESFNLRANVYTEDGSQIWQAERSGNALLETAISIASSLGDELYGKAKEALI